MLLVEHDQPELGGRREHGRARPHADAGVAFSQTPPLLVALCLRQPRVEHRHRVAEALLETGDDLSRQRDLRHEHDRRASLLERRRGRPQVDLGLARARHAVQQQPALSLPSIVAQRVEHRFERGPLVRAQRGRLGPGDSHCGVLRRGDGSAAAPAQAARGAGRDHQRQRAREGRAVLGGHPSRELDQLRGHARGEQADRLGEPLGRDLAAVGQADDDAEQPPVGEGHHQQRAELDLAPQLFAQGVVEGPAQRSRGRDRLDPGDRRGRSAGAAGLDRGGDSHRPDPRGRRGQRPAALRSASALSVRSHVKSWSSRPKCPYAAVFW